MDKDKKRGYLIATIISYTLLVSLISQVIGIVLVEITWSSSIMSVYSESLYNTARNITDIIQPRPKPPVYNNDRGGYYAKPVIYLYPEKETDITVKLDETNIDLKTTYPRYNNGWDIRVTPDGDILNKVDNTHHKYLFWDAEGTSNFDMSKGFVVSKENTEAFLKEKLEIQGLSELEINDFIVYWLPRLTENNYNLITFQNEEYNKLVPLEISPSPSSILRVFMVYKPLDKYIDIPEQKISAIERNGYTIVEWGGLEIGNEEIR